MPFWFYIKSFYITHIKLFNFYFIIIFNRIGQYAGGIINPDLISATAQTKLKRANVWSLKEEGCTHILAVTACGSLRERIEPGHFVFPDQFIDRTTKRISTYFDGSDVQHVSMGEPFSAKLRKCLRQACDDLEFAYHDGGTVVTIEGPRFSTKAESMMFRSWGCDVINMSTVPEICLARELELEYQSIAMSTDYDCWHESEEEVTMEMIFATMGENVHNVKKLIEHSIPLIKKEYELGK